MIDAYRQATLINYGYAQDLGLLDMPKVPRAGQGGLMAGLLLSLIGLVAIADQYLAIRLDWIFNLWPFALVAIGLWLIVASSAADASLRQQGTPGTSGTAETNSPGVPAVPD